MKPLVCPQAIRILLALAFLLLPSASKAALPSDTELTALANAEAALIANRWGLAPVIHFTEGTNIEFRQTGTVHVGRAGLRAILSKVDPAQHKAVIRWILGHELWHQVQKRDLAPLGADDGIGRRLRECQADVMAAEYTGDTFLAGKAPKNSLKELQFLTRVMARIMDIVQDVEVNFEGASDHPSGNERRFSIQLGSMRALSDHVDIIPNPDERQAMTIQTQHQLDMRDGEAMADWAFRTCELILHSGDGTPDLVQLKPVVEFDRRAKSPFVEYRIPYKNSGKSRISIVMQVATVAIPRASPHDVDGWLRVDGKTYRFDLAPGQSYTIEGRLVWLATDQLAPRLLSPTAREALYSAERTGAPEGDMQGQNPLPDLVPRLSRLATIIQTIANSATSQFSTIRKEPCTTAFNTRRCGLTMIVPSAINAEILYESSGAASVELEIYHGTDATRAHAAFGQFKQDLRVMYPFKPARERKTATGGEVFEFSPTNGASLELRLLKLGNDKYDVTATIVPIQF